MLRPMQGHKETAANLSQGLTAGGSLSEASNRQSVPCGTPGLAQGPGSLALSRWSSPAGRPLHKKNWLTQHTSSSGAALGQGSLDSPLFESYTCELCCSVAGPEN